MVLDNERTNEMNITPEEYRTAARVIRHMTLRADERFEKLPAIKRWWTKFCKEDSSDLYRKSALLDNLADRLEQIESEG
jgi:hypothetical protein